MVNEVDSSVHVSACYVCVYACVCMCV